MVFGELCYWWLDAESYLGSIISPLNLRRTAVIKAILTDLGNVVVLFDKRKGAELLAEKLGRPVDEIDRILNGSTGLRYLELLEVGKISTTDYHFLIQKELDGLIGPKIFWEIHNSIFTPNSEVIDTFKAIQFTHPAVQFIAVSNTDVMRLATMVWVSGLRFDKIVASCAVGFAKPDQRIFKVAAEMAEIEPRECLFIDDMGEYCQRAAAFGFQTFHYQDLSSFLQFLLKNARFLA